MEVGGDEGSSWRRNEGGVDDDFHIGEAYGCRRVQDKRRDEAKEDALINGHNLPHHRMPAVGAVRVEARQLVVSRLSAESVWRDREEVV